MLQDNFLFDGTVGDNIRYGRPDATLEEIREVSRIAHADEFIEGFEKKYDTVVGERGVKLSGGQRQRVAIARAILADPAHPGARRSDVVARQRERGADPGRPALAARRAARRSSSRTGCRRSGAPIRSSCSSTARSSSAARTRELLALGGRYRTLYDKQYNLEADRFINPGEDFTPSAKPQRRCRPPDSAL